MARRRTDRASRCAIDRPASRARGSARHWRIWPRLCAISGPTPGEDIQAVVYEVGKRHFPQPELRAWFGCLYQVLLGQAEGPRFGQFAALYGIAETTDLIERALSRETAGVADA